MGLFSKRSVKGSRVLESGTGLKDLLDLRQPPFGMGFVREAGERVVGTTPAGRPYRIFRYGYAGGLTRFADRVMVVDLPFSLPDVFWTTTGRTRVGMEAAGPVCCVQYQGLRVFSADEAFTKQVFEVIFSAVQALTPGLLEHVDMSVDRNHLIVLDPPVAEEVGAVLPGLDALIEALSAAVPRRLELEPRDAKFGFYGRPDWVYAAEGSPSLLREFGLQMHLGGSVEDVITCAWTGARMTAFRYTWVSKAAARAPMRRGMVRDTDREQTAVCAFTFHAKLPGISLNGDHLGEVVSLGNPRFSEAFDLRSTDPRIARELFSEEVQDWLLATRPYGWTTIGNQLRFEVPSHDAVVVGECEETVQGWISRMPADLREHFRLPQAPFELRE